MTSQHGERSRVGASGICARRASSCRSRWRNSWSTMRRRGAPPAAIFRPTSRNRIKTARARTCCVRRCWTASTIPEVKLRSAQVAGTLEAPQVTAHITIKDASRDVQVPVKLAIEGDEAERERRVRHPADGVRHQAVQRRARRARGAGPAAHRVQDRGGEALRSASVSDEDLLRRALCAPYTSRSAVR